MALKIMACAVVCHGAEIQGTYEPTGIYKEQLVREMRRNDTSFDGLLTPKKLEAPPQPMIDDSSKQKPQVRQQMYAGYTPWYENGRSTSNSHLMHAHGVPASQLAGLTQAEKDRLHGKMHGERLRQISSSMVKAQSAGGCPNGANCPLNSGFRRR